MLVLSRSGDAFADDTDPALRWRLPSALAPLTGADGAAQVMLARSADGGLLQLRLRALWELNEGERPVPIDSGRFRLLLQTPSARESGAWWPTPAGGDAVVDRSLSLGALEAAIARRLGKSGDDVVEVEVELTVRGFAPSLPWLASVPADALRQHVAALLGAQPATWEQVEAAFLGLAEDLFTWHPLEPAAIRPPRDEALLAIAQHVAPLLLAGSSAEGYSVAAGGPPRLDANLRVPRLRSERFGLRWSFSQFLATVAEPARHLVDVTLPAPFEAATLTIVNDLPLADSGIRSLAVEVRSGGPSGLLTHEFLPGQPSAARLHFVRETFEALELQWRVRYAVATADGTAVGATDFRPASVPLIELNAASVGLRALRIACEPATFAHVEALEVTLGTRTLRLTRAAPVAWAVGRQPPATAALVAVLASGQRHALGERALTALGLTLDATICGIGETAPVSLRAPVDLAARAAYLAVQIEGQPWRSLDAGAALSIALRRASRFEPPRLRYRTRHVARGAGGAPAVIAESAWRAAAGESVEVEF